ncbi:hypothetical protein Cadr_000026348 [Camelus dromedarius]|uniref:Uncharacterized protein n=1 Tax=Camelus dromedarius TaxID=9838 RepID=A0A5N4CEJ8_CAMDR|nr:hypothetical protein Cadr_000026348 [Camelus dromedarius]
MLLGVLWKEGPGQRMARPRASLGDSLGGLYSAQKAASHMRNVSASFLKQLWKMPERPSKGSFLARWVHDIREGDSVMERGPLGSVFPGPPFPDLSGLLHKAAPSRPTLTSCELSSPGSKGIFPTSSVVWLAKPGLWDCPRGRRRGPAEPHPKHMEYIPHGKGKLSGKRRASAWGAGAAPCPLSPTWVRSEPRGSWEKLNHRPLRAPEPGELWGYSRSHPWIVGEVMEAQTGAALARSLPASHLRGWSAEPDGRPGAFLLRVCLGRLISFSVSLPPGLTALSLWNPKGCVFKNALLTACSLLGSQAVQTQQLNDTRHRWLVLGTRPHQATIEVLAGLCSCREAQLEKDPLPSSLRLWLTCPPTVACHLGFLSMAANFIRRVRRPLTPTCQHNRQPLTLAAQRNQIMTVTARHLHHCLLVRSESQLLPVTRAPLSLRDRKPLFHARQHTGLCKQPSGNGSGSHRSECFLGLGGQAGERGQNRLLKGADTGTAVMEVAEKGKADLRSFKQSGVADINAPGDGGQAKSLRKCVFLLWSMEGHHEAVTGELGAMAERGTPNRSPRREGAAGRRQPGSSELKKEPPALPHRSPGEGGPSQAMSSAASKLQEGKKSHRAASPPLTFSRVLSAESVVY